MYSLHCYPMVGNLKYPQQPTFDEFEQNESKRTEFWTDLITKWDASDPKMVKRAKIMTNYGPIPFSLRSEAWFVISGAAELMQKHRDLYRKLYSSPSDKANLIEKDLPRTFCSHDHLSGFEVREGSQSCLRRILTAYSNLDPLLGYCQGMNYIAALLLTVFKGTNEEQAFWTFVVILRQVRSIFIDGLPGFHKIVHYFRRLCRHHLPQLHEKWQSLGIDVYKLILTPWFHSLFSYPCLDISHTARIWDLFITHDFSVCIKFAFTILAFHRRRLSKMEFVEIVDFCKLLQCMKQNGKQLIQKSISLQLNEKYLRATRDLTKFDWHINQHMKKEYQRHIYKQKQKESQKNEIEQKYKMLYEQKQNSESQSQSQSRSIEETETKMNDNNNNNDNDITDHSNENVVSMNEDERENEVQSVTRKQSESVISVSLSSESSSAISGIISAMNMAIHQ